VSDALQPLPNVPSREQIERFEGALLDMEQAGAGVVIDTSHHFADGQYARTVFLPAGTFATGGEHKHGHLNVCHGDITVWTEEGMKRLTGYHVIPSSPGAKRVAFAHADTYWTSVHLNPGDERDLHALENNLVENPERLQSRRTGAIASDTVEAIE